MTIVSTKQLATRKRKLKELSKHIELTQEKRDKALLAVLRSSVRRTWMRHPVKLLKLEQAVEVDEDPETRTVWKVKCERCCNYFNKNKVEIDHKIGEHQLKSFSDVEQFTRSILDVGLEDLSVICKPCHQIKTYAERHGLDEVDAELKLEQIAWSKLNKPIEQKQFLIEQGFSESDVSNGPKRIASYLQYLKNKS